MQKVEKLIEQRYADIHARQKMLVNTWMPYIEAVNEYRISEGSSALNDYETRQVAQCLENAFVDVAVKQKGRLNETTYQDAIAFLGVQMSVISAMIPSLVLNQIATVQALDRRISSVFYMDVEAGQTKGAVTSGDVLLSSRTGHASSADARNHSS